jgi:hypothetical protein
MLLIMTEFFVLVDSGWHDSAMKLPELSIKDDATNLLSGAQSIGFCVLIKHTSNFEGQTSQVYRGGEVRRQCGSENGYFGVLTSTFT